MDQLTHNIVATVFLDLAIIVILTRAVGALFRRMGQPAVVGEILAGIALGPSLLGAIPVGGSTLAALMFPTEALHQLTGLANLGLVIFMMIVGLELNLRPAHASGSRAVVISAASVLLPLGLGLLLGAWLFSTGAGGSSRVAFALFLGVAMSVTAFPVLARILVERRLHRTPLGVLVLACAGVDDVLAWSLLALATAVAGGGGPGQLVRVVLLLAVFCLVLTFVLRPLLRRLIVWHGRVGRLTPAMLAVILVCLVLSAAATELIGVHFVFGAFLFGAALPRAHSAALVRDLLDKLEQVAVLVLLPVFFVVTGLAVNLRALNAGQLGILGTVLLVACVGKFVGAAGAARLMRVPPRQAVAIGILMNTRGLTELVVVNVGYAAGILSRDLLTILVVMAVVTTVITKPLLQLVYSDAIIARDVADAERSSLEVPDAYRCLILVDDIAAAAPYAAFGRDLAPVGRQTELVISCLVPLPVGRFELATGFSQELDDVATRLEAANALAARLTEGDVTCSVVCRFSDNVLNDTLAHADSLQPDCVIADGKFQHADAFAARLPGSARVILVGQADQISPDLRVAASVHGGPDTALALVTALQLARSRGARLGLIDGPSRQRWSRPAALVQRLQRVGFDVELWPADYSGDALVITERDGLVTNNSRSVAQVRSVRDGQASDIKSMLDELIPVPVQPGSLKSELPEPVPASTGPNPSGAVPFTVRRSGND